MKYLIDSGDASAIKQICDYYPIVGVTTNPSIIAKSGIDLKTLITEIRAIIGNSMLHIQVLSEKCETMAEGGKRIVEFACFFDFIFCKDFVCKKILIS